MNQHLDMFSSVILKERNVKQNISKETYAELCLSEPGKGVKMSNVRTRTADLFTKTFSEWPRTFKGRNGAETRLCDVTVVLNIAVFLHESFVRERGLNAHPVLLGK